MASGLQRRGWAGGCHAACSYSLISPPRALRRRISAVVRAVIAAGVISALSGGRRFLARCGRRWLQCATYSSRTADRCRCPAMSIRSVTSDRTVRTRRSAKAFAPGLHGLVRARAVPCALPLDRAAGAPPRVVTPPLRTGHIVSPPLLLPGARMGLRPSQPFSAGSSYGRPAGCRSRCGGRAVIVSGPFPAACALGLAARTSVCTRTISPSRPEPYPHQELSALLVQS